MTGIRTTWIALAAVAAGVGIGLYWNGSAPAPAPASIRAPSVAPPPPQPTPAVAPQQCREARYAGAALRNGLTLRALDWAPFRRPERGWETYAPLIAGEIGTGCAPNSEGFAGALARWQGRRGQPATGEVTPEVFAYMKGVWQERRPFVRRGGACPDPPDESALSAGLPGEGYGGKQAQLLPGAFAAYRRMAADARAQVPAIAADPRYLTIFSSYRSPEYDAARCARDNNCDGVVRATCSPHRTGRALDLYVGQAPGYGPDSTADPNRLHLSRTPAYRWMVLNAHRYGFVNYPFEPWHWEWIGDGG